MNKKLGLVVALLCIPWSALAMHSGKPRQSKMVWTFTEQTSNTGTGSFEGEASSDEEKRKEAFACAKFELSSSDQEKESRQLNRQHNQQMQQFNSGNGSEEETQKVTTLPGVDLRLNNDSFSYTPGSLENAPPSYQPPQQEPWESNASSVSVVQTNVASSEDDETESYQLNAQQTAQGLNDGGWREVNMCSGKSRYVAPATNQFEQGADSDEEGGVGGYTTAAKQKAPRTNQTQYTSDLRGNQDPQNQFNSVASTTASSHYSSDHPTPHSKSTFTCPMRFFAVVAVIAGACGLYEWAKEQRAKKRCKPAGAKR